MQASHLDWLTETLAQHLAEALELMTGEAPQVAWTTSETPTSAEPLAWWGQSFNLRPGAALWIGAPETSWRRIGEHVLGAAGISPSGDDEIKNTYQEILGQAVASVARSLGTRLNREVVCEETGEQPPPDDVPVQALVDLTLGESAKLSLWMAFSPELLRALESPADTPSTEQPESKAETAETAPALPEPAPRPSLPAGARTLDLLLEVEMPVSVSFGRTQLPLRDLLKLTTGSIIELNRTVNEPVEVIVNNCVIARGEVVVVEGNYGIRIKEIISRQERLRTLR